MDNLTKQTIIFPGLLMVSALAASGCSSAFPSQSTSWTRPDPVPVERRDWVCESVPALRGSELTSRHYALRTTCKNKRLLDALPIFLEGCWDAYAALLPSDRSLPSPLPAHLFQSRWEWEAFTDRFAGARAVKYKQIRSGGYSERGVTVSYYFRQQATFSVLAHEGLHQYLEVMRGRETPAWLNEGLACQFEGFDIDEYGRPHFTPDVNTLRKKQLREMWVAGQFKPLSNLLATDAGQEIGKPSEQVLSYYAQAWSLVLYLLQPKIVNPYHDAFLSMLKDLGTEAMARRVEAYQVSHTDGSISPGEAAFRAYITSDLDAFEKSYRHYVVDHLDLPLEKP